MTQKKKKRSYEVDHDERNKRRRALHRSERVHLMIPDEGDKIENRRVIETSLEQTEGRQIVAEMAQAFISTVEFYKTEYGGSKPHDEAVKEALSMTEHRREWVQGLQPEKVDWGHIAAVAEVSMEDGLQLWSRVREAADDELETGRRAAKITGSNTEAYALAQFLAIRDAFADQWQPQGGIESAMIDMMAVSFSLQMHWSTIAYERTERRHNEQRKEVQRFESQGWKSPYQSEADAVDQAHRLADGYNRQFLRVLRQLRDLRRYAPVVIQNNGGQVNVAGQQVNVNKQ
jgi:hypothetical protein